MRARSRPVIKVTRCRHWGPRRRAANELAGCYPFVRGSAGAGGGPADPGAQEGNRASQGTGPDLGRAHDRHGGFPVLDSEPQSRALFVDPSLGDLDPLCVGDGCQGDPVAAGSAQSHRVDGGHVCRAVDRRRPCVPARSTALAGLLRLRQPARLRASGDERCRRERDRPRAWKNDGRRGWYRHRYPSLRPRAWPPH